MFQPFWFTGPFVPSSVERKTFPANKVPVLPSVHILFGTNGRARVGNFTPYLAPSDLQGRINVIIHSGYTNIPHGNKDWSTAAFRLGLPELIHNTEIAFHGTVYHRSGYLGWR
jgi:hypothetical protein